MTIAGARHGWWCRVGTSVGPTLAALDGRVWMGWKGVGGDERIWLCDFDGRRWDPQVSLPAMASSVGPTLAAFDGRLPMAWKLAGGAHAIWWASSFAS